MMISRKALPLLAFVLLAATLAVSHLAAQTMTCIRTTRTYRTTYYYSDGHTRSYTWVEIEEICTPTEE